MARPHVSGRGKRDAEVMLTGPGGTGLEGSHINQNRMPSSVARRRFGHAGVPASSARDAISQPPSTLSIPRVIAANGLSDAVFDPPLRPP